MLAGASNHILGLEDGKKRFADQVLSASKAFALCCTLDDALDYRDELAFFQAIKSALATHAPRTPRSRMRRRNMPSARSSAGHWSPTR